MLCRALAAYVVGIETGSPWLGALAGARWPARCSPLVHAAHGADPRGQPDRLGARRQLPRHRAHRAVRAGLRRPGRRAVRRPWAIPGLSELPFLGPILFEHDPLDLPRRSSPCRSLTWVLCRTRFGLMPASGRRGPRGARDLRHVGHQVRWHRRCSSAGPWRASAGRSCPPLHPQLVRADDRRPWARGRRPRHLRRLEPDEARSSAPTSSAGPSPSSSSSRPGARTSPRTCSRRCPYLIVLVVLALLSRRRIHGGPAALEKVFEGYPDARHPSPVPTNPPPTPNPEHPTCTSQGGSHDQTRRTRAAVVPGLVGLALVAAGCGRRRIESDSSPLNVAHGTRRPASPQGGEVDTVGFIYVGPKDDFGYNQAAYEGSRRHGRGGRRRRAAPGRERARDRRVASRSCRT